MNLSNIIQVETQLGDAVTVGELTITPQTQAVILHWPRGGWVWNRPIGVLVDRAGQVERVPIVDVTRYATWALSGLLFGFSVIIFMLALRHRSLPHE